jgi:hypothetical protein
MIKKAEILAALFAVLIVWTGSLRAELITIDLTAEVTYVDDLADLLGGKIAVGDIITGSYSYDSDTLDTNPIETVGDYWHYTPPYGISLSVGGFVFQTDPDNVDFLVEIVNDHTGIDGYLLRSYNNLPLSSGIEVEHIAWQLGDYSMNALSSAALPTSPPVLEDWDNDHFYITVGYKGSSMISAKVTSAIPEPATVLFLALGSLVLTKRR